MINKRNVLCMIYFTKLTCVDHGPPFNMYIDLTFRYGYFIYIFLDQCLLSYTGSAQTKMVSLVPAVESL